MFWNKMCKKKQFKYCQKEIDECMKNICEFIDEHSGYLVRACCCGHGKYPPTIVVTAGSVNREIFSGKEIERVFKFYKKDKQGYYYIPEVSKVKWKADMK